MTTLDLTKMYKETSATLTYGNVSIKIPYTIFRYLSMHSESAVFSKAHSIFNRGCEEILKEMKFELYGEMPRYHRDSEEFNNLPFTHNCIHPNNEEITIKEIDNAKIQEG